MGIDKLINNLMPSAIKIVVVIVLFSLVKEFFNGSRGLKLVGAIIIGGLVIFVVKDPTKAENFGRIFYNFVINILGSLEEIK